ncbi:MAG: glycosyltransferase family 9 protein [Ignavibacteriae bacterium]|nr:glycosyltransferase family 9 protein [Ignavibacteriota bacterium]
MNEKLLLHPDCRHFRGDIPCKPHKQHGVHCDGCSYYDPTDSHILIIKLGALGDVIRTTPLLHRLKQDHPRAMIWWLTLSPEILPPQVDVKLNLSPESLTTLRSVRFKLLYNFDKEKEACALTDQLSSDIKKGFTLKNGKCAPIDKDAEHKFATGIFDDLNKANTKSYPQELFELCGMEFQGEKYILPVNEWNDKRWKLNPKKKIIGLNTGCGGRWTSRLWPDASWVMAAKHLKKTGYEVVLLGGEQEHKKNLALAKKSGARYFGHYPLQQFINLVNRCDLVVTAVTMAMHITIGLGKKIVLFNNIFNKHEFELYGLGEILEPDFECTCFYSPTCPNNCMQYLKPERVVSSVQRLLPRK